MSKQTDYILWDWNGTLLDDVNIGISIINQMLSKRNLPTLDSKQAYRKVFRFPVREYYLDLGFNFVKESFEDLSVEFVKLYQAEQPPIFNDAVQTLAKIKEMGITQLILSASERQQLMLNLNRFSINGYFAEFLTQNDIYATGKQQVAETWIKTNNICPSRIKIVGDTMHDYEVAQTLGCKCLLIDRGHQTLDDAKIMGATILNNLSDVISFL